MLSIGGDSGKLQGFRGKNKKGGNCPVAEAEVTLKNSSLPIKLVLGGLQLLVPFILCFNLWATIAIFTAVTAGQIQMGPASVVVFIELLVFCANIWAVMVLSDQTVFINRDGISLPFTICPSLKGRVDRPWALLKDVKYFAAAGGRLVLFFKEGKPAEFKLAKLSEQELNQLLVAIDVWGGGNDRYPAVTELRDQLSIASGDMKRLGYTEMWEDELARRFGATNFVPLEPGHLLRSGDLKVIRQLAFGGLSAIYLVKDKMRTSYVVKEAVVPAESNSAMRKRADEFFRREADILSKLTHPQIAKVFDHFIENDRNYLLLEYLPGKDLRRYVKDEGAQEESTVVSWALQIAELLNHLHSQSVPILHRDLSPDNLILKEDGTVALIDFGAANEFAGTATGTMIGKHSYIAAEQLRGKASMRSDIYAFGCTLAFLLTGQDPDALSVSHPRSMNSNVSEDLDAIVARCTQLDEKDRYQSAQEVYRALDQLSKKYTIAASTQSRSQVARNE